MLAKSITALAALAFAVNVAADPQPYKPMLMKMSTRQLFGIGRRQDTPGYQPEQAVCGTGNTCEEACGAGYTTCASSDNEVHCYSPAAKQACCPDRSGNSCDDGYYCTSDNKGDTWCCPNSMDLTACAAAYTISGGLVSQTAPATSTSTTSSSTSSTPAPITTSETTTTITTTSSSSIIEVKNTTSFAAIKTTSAGTASLAPTSSPASNTTVSIPTSPSPTVSRIPEGAANMAAPASALLLIAGLAALL